MSALVCLRLFQLETLTMIGVSVGVNGMDWWPVHVDSLPSA